MALYDDVVIAISPERWMAWDMTAFNATLPEHGVRAGPLGRDLTGLPPAFRPAVPPSGICRFSPLAVNSSWMAPMEYQLQAAIAAVHDEAATAEDTDWPQILALYGLLERMTGNPMVTLNRAVALGMVDGPAAGLRLLKSLDQRLAGHHRLDAVRAHLLEMAGDHEAAIAHYRTAAGRTASVAERNYLTTRAARLAPRR